MSDRHGVRRRPGCGAGGSAAARATRWPRCRSACTSTGGSRRTTSRPRARTPGCCTAPACSTTTSSARCSAPSTTSTPRSRDGSFRPTVEDEDVHTALERGLLERVGALGGKLRAGRSRNDQVATDLRLYLRDAARQVAARVAELETALIGLAERHRGTADARHDPPAARPAGAARPPPARARARASSATSSGCVDWDERAALSPLGAGALAGSSLPLDPEAVAAELGFDGAVRQLDRRRVRPRLRGRVPASSPRCSACTCRGSARRSASGRPPSSAGSTLDDAYSTGSSIMPQKKNPDVAELARGKSGRLIGNLTALLDHAQGPAAGLRPRPAGGQGAGLRLGRAAAARAARDGRHGRDAARRRRAADRGGGHRARAGHRRRRVAGAHRRRRSATRTRSPAGWCGWCDEHGLRALGGRRRRRWPRSTSGSRPSVRSVLSVRGALRRALDPRRHRAGPGRRAARPRWPTPRTQHAAWATGER